MVCGTGRAPITVTDNLTQAEGYVSPSFLAENLQKIQEKPPGEDRDTMLAAVKNVAAIMFAGE